LFLINIPKGTVKIDDYPAIRDHLLPFKFALEARATKQEWFELQQPQLVYQPAFSRPKIVYQDICNSSPFWLDKSGSFLANTCYFVASGEPSLASLLNSKLAWFYWSSLTTIARGGYLRLFTQFVETTPLPEGAGNDKIGALADRCQTAASDQQASIAAVLRRIPDLCTPGRAPKLNNRLREWWTLDFKSFQVEIKKAFKADIPLKQRNEWENFLREEGENVRRLTAEIEQAEREIDAIVYKLFDLTPDEIALLESSLAGQY
jgi:hypothetical protein